MIEAAMVECNAAAVVVEGPGCDAKFLSEWVAAGCKGKKVAPTTIENIAIG
jgi:hypothetical protein